MNLVPVAYAAVDMTKFGNVVDPIMKNLVYPVLTFMFALAVLFFVYGVIRMVISTEGKARDDAKRSILYGVIGLFIMTCAWGIVFLVSNTIKSI